MEINLYHVSLGELMHEILVRNEVSVDTFCARFGFSRATVFRWLNDSGLVTKVPYAIVASLAEVDRCTPASIFQRLGIDVHTVPQGQARLSMDDLRLYPLIRDFERATTPAVSECLKLAISAREQYFDDGNMSRALAIYERAYQYAQYAKEPYLAAYLQLYVSNLLWMTGRLDEARRMSEETHDVALKIQAEGNKKQDKALSWLGSRLAVHSKLRTLWIDGWAHAVTRGSIAKGEAIIEELKACHFHQRIPYVYEYLARCAVALGETEMAREYVELAELHAYGLPRKQYAQYELFLDAGSKSQGGLGYSRQEDHFLETKMDILIGIGAYDQAFEAYQQINVHRNPQAYLTLHHWFDPHWQMLLSSQSIITPVRDVKLAYSLESWNEELAETGNKRVQALLLVSQGRNLLANGLLPEAQSSFVAAGQLAHEAKALDVEAQAQMHYAEVTARRGERTVANHALSVIEGKVARIDNPYLRYQLHTAAEAVMNQ